MTWTDFVIILVLLLCLGGGIFWRIWRKRHGKGGCPGCGGCSGCSGCRNSNGCPPSAQEDMPENSPDDSPFPPSSGSSSPKP